MTKLLLLDLDGTIRKPKSTEKFINIPEDQELIKGADTVAKEFIDDGWIIVGVSNQGGVQAGYKTLRSTIKEMRCTLKLAPWLDSIYFCPDKDPGTLCVRVLRPYWLPFWLRIETISLWNGNERWKAASDGYRKPNGGMLRTAMSDTVESVLTHQHEKILMVGDRPEDEGAAQAAKVDFVWADDWISEGLAGLGKAIAVHKRQAEALEWTPIDLPDE